MMIKDLRLHQKRTFGLASVMALCAAFPGLGQQIQECGLVDGVLPADCQTAGHGQIVSDPVNQNVEIDVQREPRGFSISVDGRTVAGEPRRVIAGNTSPAGKIRAQDLALDSADVHVRYDGTRTERRLNVLTSDLRTEFQAGDTVRFNATTSYAGWVDRAELRILPVRRGFGRPDTIVVPVEPNGTIGWTMPEGDEDSYRYVLRVYDSNGRYDETAPRLIARSDDPVDPDLNGPVISAGEGEDNTARRGILVSGGVVTVNGTDLPPGARATVMGRNVPVDANGQFVTDLVLPAGTRDVTVALSAPNARGTTLLREVVIPRNDWFATGLADLTVGKRGESLGSGDSFSRGRIAGYARGVVNGRTTVIVSGDTGEGELDELFDDVLTKDPRDVLERIDPDTFYPTYGDDSTIVEDAPTSGKIFARIERDGSHLMWGDFENDLSGSDFLSSSRELYGAQLEFNSLDVTIDGENRLSATAYAAQPDSLPQRDELRGTGGSVYSLQRRDLVPGSESVVIEIVDRVTGRVVSTQALASGGDYRIDYFQGTIILDDPLSGGVSDGTVVSNSTSGDFDANLVVQYEYLPTGVGLDGAAAGGRIEAWLPGDILRLGVTAVDEATDTVDLRVLAADAHLRFSEGSYIEAEIAESRGTGFGYSFSADGGFTFVNIGSGGTATRADAVRLNGVLDLADVIDGGDGTISAYYEEKDAGFATLSESTLDDQTLWGIEIQAQVNERLGFRGAFEDFETAGGDGRQQIELEIDYQISDRTRLTFGVENTNETRAGDPGNTGDRTDLGFRLLRGLEDDQEVYVYVQGTVARDGTIDKNNRLGFGGRFNLNERLTAEAEASSGNGGFGARALLELRPNDANRLYFGYELDPSRNITGTTLNGQHEGTFILGAERQVSEGVSYYAEDNYDLFGNRREITRAYGVSYTPSAIWNFSADLEIGKVRDSNDTNIDRHALGFGAAYDGGLGVAGSARLEYRIDEQTVGGLPEERETWAFVGDYTREINPDWRFLASIDALVSDSDQSDFLNGRYVEASLGYAYRPIDNDRLNVLARYTYLEDLPGSEQVSADGSNNGAEQRSHIFSIDAIYELDETWEFGGKLAYRLGETAPRGTNTFTSNDAGLLALRATYAIEQRWELTGEARMLTLPDQDSRDFGALLTVYRSINDNAKIGIGYNFGTFSDDLRDTTLDDKGIFLNIQAKF